MSICRKCNYDLPRDNFATYYHSTQQKYRTRRVCIKCFNSQKAEYTAKKRKLLMEAITPEPTPTVTPSIEMKYCRYCDTMRPITNYYKQTLHKCKTCISAEDKIFYVERRKAKGGSEKVLSKPNQYRDEFQRQQTFMVLEALGYTFNEENGIWYKLPWKTETGEFPQIVTTRYKYQKPTNKKKKFVFEQIDKGIPIKEIATAIEVNINTIYKWLRNRRSSELEK